MVLENTYKTILDEGKYLFNQKYFIQNLLHPLRKDNNVKEIIILMEKYSNTDLFSEEFRREIIINGFSDNIKIFEKIVNKLYSVVTNKDGFLHNVNAQTIRICCTTFPDHIGEHYLRYIGLQKIISGFSKIIFLYDNGRYNKEEKTEILDIQNFCKIFFDNIYHNMNAYQMYQEQMIDDVKEQLNSSNIELKESFDKIFNVLGKPSKYNELFNIEKIKNILEKIEPENLKEDKEDFFNHFNKLLSFDLSHTLQKIIRYNHDNHWVFINLNDILVVFSENYLNRIKI